MRGIIHRGYSLGKNCRAVSSKDFWNNGEQFGASCNNKINGIECRQVCSVIHTDNRGREFAKAVGTSVSGKQRIASSEPSCAAGDQCKKGLSGRK